MEASATFENILAEVQKSNLNFKLEISPFSAVICLKKSFIKDKFGQLLTSNPEITSNQINFKTLHQKNLDLEYSYQQMKFDHENALTANRNLQIEIDHLQSILKKESSGDIQNDHDSLKIVNECLEKERALKNKEIQEIVKQNNS